MTEPARELRRAPRRIDSPDARTLLINGERLRLRLDAPKRPWGPSEAPYNLSETIGRLIPQLHTVNTQIAALPNELQSDVPVIEVTLVPQYLSASAFPAKLLHEAGLRLVGTRPGVAPKKKKHGVVEEDSPTKSVYLALEDGNLDRLGHILDNPQSRTLAKKVAEEILALQSLELATPSVDLHGEYGADGNLLEVVMHPQLDSRGRLSAASNHALDRLETFTSRLGGKVQRDWIRESDGLAFVPVFLPPGQIENFRQHNGMRTIHEMPQLRPIPEVVQGSQTSGITLKASSTPRSSDCLRVAVFDAGVEEESAYWQGRVNNIILGAVQVNQGIRRHGALVTSSLLYGPIIGDTLPEPADMEIHHYEVVPQQGRTGDFEMYWLLDAIESVLRSGEHFDVVTVCVAPHLLIDDSLVNRWTSVLDRLSYELQTLFVVAAGNNGEATSAGDQNRVLVPGDASNVLTVGAAAQVLRPSSRADYSAVGPGRPVAEIRPSGIAFGGTEQEPFVAVDNDGTALQSIGTSCAAPLVTRSFASLCKTIGRERISPVTMRAFAIHYAIKKSSDKETQVGYGHFPTAYDFLQDVPENEAHVLYTGLIGREEFLPLAIPVPDQTAGKLKLELTLVTVTDVDSFNAVDYAKAGLEATFRPHAQIYNFRKEGMKSLRLNTSVDAAQVAKLLAEDWTPSPEPVSDSIFRRLPASDLSEASLRADGKWQSVRVAQHTYMNASGKLHRPRIDITHLAREAGSLAYGTSDLEWALLVSLTAAPGSNLYSRVRAQYEVLATLPVSSTVQVNA